MKLGATGLKVITGVSTVAVCGASTVLVAVNDPKPASAPLRPQLASHVTSPTALAPLPPSCGVTGKAITLTAQQQAELQTLTATPAAQRKAVLMGFPSADRLQITAYMAQQRKKTQSSSSGGTCGAGSASPGAQITSNTTTGGPVVNPVISYVS